MTGWELGLVLVSALLHSSWNAATKGSASPTAFLFAMELVSLPVCALVLAFGFRPSEVPTGVWACAMATAVVHACYAYWLSRAYAHADLSVVYPIARSTPALVPLVAWPLFGEVPSWLGAAGIALVVAGMWAVQTGGRVRREAFRGLGARFAYLTLAATVGYSLIDKEAMRLLAEAPWSGRAPRPLVYLSLFWAIYLPLFLTLVLRRVRPREILRVARAAPGRLVASSAVALLSYVLILEALRTAPVGYVVAVRQASVLFAVALGVLWLRERPGPERLAGALAVVAGVAAIALAP